MAFIGFIIFIMFLLSYPKLALLFCVSVLVGIIHPALGIALFFGAIAIVGALVNSRK